MYFNTSCTFKFVFIWSDKNRDHLRHQIAPRSCSSMIYRSVLCSVSIYWFNVSCKMSKAWKRIYISQLWQHKSSSQLKTHGMIKMNYQHDFHQWLFLNPAAATQESQMITIVSFQYSTRRAIYVEHLMRADGDDNLADPDTLPWQAISEPPFEVTNSFMFIRFRWFLHKAASSFQGYF